MTLKELKYFLFRLVFSMDSCTWDPPRKIEIGQFYQALRGGGRGLKFSPNSFVPTCSKMLDFKALWKPGKPRILCSTKLSLESLVFHCLCENFAEYPHGIILISYSILQQFSWFKNYKQYWFSKSLLELLLLVPK